MLLVLLSVIYQLTVVSAVRYTIPDHSFEILKPDGFAISIEDDGLIDKFSLYLYDGVKDDDNTYIKTNSTINGRWTIPIRSIKLSEGDEYDYEINVHHKIHARLYETEGTFSFDGENITVTKYKTYVSSYRILAEAPCEDKDSPTRISGRGHRQDGIFAVSTGRFVVSDVAYPSDYDMEDLSRAETCSNSLIFVDEFNDLLNWKREIKFAGEPDYEFVIYMGHEKNLYVDESGLHIKPTLTEDTYGHGFVMQRDGLDLGDRCTGTMEHDCIRKPLAYNILPPVLSGRITTKDFSFLYGRIDIRAKLPQGDWIYPELFLTPKVDTRKWRGHDSGFMRIAFCLGNDDMNKVLTGRLHLQVSHNKTITAKKNITSNTAWTDDFHIYSLIWQPDRITIMVDNETYGNFYPPTGWSRKRSVGETEAWFNKEMSITIGVGVGGHSIPDSADKPYTNDDAKGMSDFYKARSRWSSSWKDDERRHLIVDYVRVHSL